MKKKAKKLLPENFYHIYNRGNNGEKIFYKEENYKFFLKRFDFYLSNYLDLFAFVLMPNHFHLLIQPKRVPPFKKVVPLEQKFRFFFTSYAMAINKQQNRHGSLFEKNFRRKLVGNSDYLKQLVFYIHNNPVHHGFAVKKEDWLYSSYNLILNDKQTKLCKKETISLFSGKEKYKSFHDEEHDLRLINEWLME